ncbi:hypothetical protein ACFS5L_09180 [Streptomyces phyllanthi]|uniref:hypothetical protein n=1 Tax=Streptomyces phyllanthi TaxID=1803180 RepID=UPI001D159093|nr:hypothetical protein [Streptomyces phyllanthi]
MDLALDAPEAARRSLEAAVPTVLRMGSARISLWAQGCPARTQFALGAWPAALDTVQRAAVHLAEVRIELSRPPAHWTGAQIHALPGDWEDAEHHVGEAAAGPDHYQVMLIPSCLARAQVAEARGDYERVVEALSPVVRLPHRLSVDEPGFWPWPDVYANTLVQPASAWSVVGSPRPEATSTPPARCSTRPLPTSNTSPSLTTGPGQLRLRSDPAPRRQTPRRRHRSEAAAAVGQARSVAEGIDAEFEGHGAFRLSC